MAIGSTLKATPPSPPEFRYRYIDVWNYSDGVDVIEKKYPVIKTTNCGAWIAEEGWEPHHGNPIWTKFVLNGAGKRYAHKDRRWAWHSFCCRKSSQVRILEKQLKKAYTAQKLAANVDDTTLGSKRKYTIPSNFISHFDQDVIISS